MTVKTIDKNTPRRLTVGRVVLFLFFFHTKNQLKTIQKIEHDLAYMDYAMIFCLQFY